MSALLWMPGELRAAGLKVETVKGWRTRGRPGAFDPFAVEWHHTGTKASKENPHPTLGLLVKGTAALTGPLCQLSPGFDGVIRVVAAGRANHAGTNRGSGPVPAGDGNAQMVGLEFDYSGSQDMSDEQYAAGVKATVVLLRHFRNDQSFVRGHKETSTAGKWDPGRKGAGSPQYLMDGIRADVRAALAPPKVRFRILNADTTELAHSIVVAQGAKEDDRLVEFLTNRKGLLLREMREGRRPRIDREKV